jgi:hypothetical protein
MARGRGASAEVALDLAHWTDLGVVRILSCRGAGSTLPQQIPALVELLFNTGQLNLLLVAGQLASPESLAQLVFRIDQLPDAAEDIMFIDHPDRPLVKIVAARILTLNLRACRWRWQCLPC